MGFRIFILLTALLIPAIMLGFGTLFIRQAPKEINCLFGYRTTRSMKNRDTWEFAHRHIGRTWRIVGAVLLPLSVLPVLLASGGEDAVGNVGAIVVTLQLIPLLGSIVPTELALKRTFDENGRRMKP